MVYAARIRILGCTSTSFIFTCIYMFFGGGKQNVTVKEKNKILQHFISPPSIYINTYMQRFSPSGPGFFTESGPPSVESRPLGSHPMTLCAVCAWVCVYTHGVCIWYTHVQSLVRQKYKSHKTIPPAYLSFCKKKTHVKQQVLFID